MAPFEDPFKVGERVLCFHGMLLYEAKVIDSKPSEEVKGQKKYLIHYKGWKNTWDDWVPVDRVRKDNEENKELARNIKRQYDTTRSAAIAKSGAGKRRGDDPVDDDKTAGTRGKRGRNMEIETEEEFLRRPEIYLPMPDTLKSILVDDWEYVSKNQELVPLPHKFPVTSIMEDYNKEEAPKRRPGSPEASLLEEVIAGIPEYFNIALGRVLLYKFERLQYSELRALFEKAAAGSEWDGKNVSDIYGPEHLLRLFSELPSMLAQTNMDKQATEAMREELTKLLLWIHRNSARLFSVAYEKAPPEYIEKAK